MTVVLRQEVRALTAQHLVYTFHDETGAVLDLSSYDTAWVELKLFGEGYATLEAAIVAPASSGQVEYQGHTFPTTGVWSAQFYVVDHAGNRVFGEPVQFRVYPNVEDLTLPQTYRGILTSSDGKQLGVVTTP